MTDDTTDGTGPQTPTKRQSLERITPEGRPLFYANNVSIEWSIWDFALDFGIVVEADDERILFRDAARVIMSPQHALVFAEVIARNVEKYEAQFGPIPRHPGITLDDDEPGGE